MNWLDKLERKLGKYSIQNLALIIVILNAVVYLLWYVDKSGLFIGKLILIPQLVMQGEVWRLFTYVFIPPSVSVIWIIFVLYFYYMIGTALEHEWGSFKFNIYYLLGMLGTTIAAFFFGAIGTATYINLSLFLAFARLYPEYEILLFFVLPVKVKYLAWIDWALIWYTVIFIPDFRAAAIVSIINYFIFFGKDIVLNTKSYGRKKVYHAKISRDITIHKCTVCGKTEKDDSKIDFRYCSTCEGDYEYCMDHLKSHEHIKKH